MAYPKKDARFECVRGYPDNRCEWCFPREAQAREIIRGAESQTWGQGR